MILDKVLILKGLGGITALGGTIAAAWYGISSLGSDSAAKELKKSLGLPENDSDCKLPTNDNKTTICTLDTNKLKAIKFDGKQENPTITVNETVTLTITKVDSTDSIFGRGGYKFAFNSTEDLSIPKSTSGESISIKKGTNTEFKIKETTPTNGGAKTLSLEKAWTVTELAKQVGLTCTSESSCTPGDTIKGYKNGNTTKEEATIAEESKSKTISVTKDQENHNQGFKFTVSEDICLQGGSSEKIATGSYEIKEETGKWYLIKKETTNRG